jgi:hypothetical protein
MSKSKSHQPLGPRRRTPAAAEYLGIAESTLEKMRVAGTGPEFEIVGEKTVVYSEEALEDYLAKRRVRSTSEAQQLRRRGGRRSTSRADLAASQSSAAPARRQTDSSNSLPPQPHRREGDYPGQADSGERAPGSPRPRNGRASNPPNPGPLAHTSRRPKKGSS